MSVISSFLSKNSIRSVTNLPLVHSTRAFHLRQFQKDGVLHTSECDVFVGDKLNYFFVGRPAYKYVDEGAEGEYWEFPCCFIFDFSSITDVRRIYPFDSGAFHRKIYPSYMKMMNLASFETASIADAPGKIIGAFFGSAERYFKLEAKGKDDFVREYSLEVMDMELKALHRLAYEKAPKTFDDRRLTIELQSGSDVDLAITKPLAVVAPSDYFEDSEFRRHVVEVWSAEPISYSIGPLSISNSYGQIYEKVRDFYKSRGYL